MATRRHRTGDEIGSDASRQGRTRQPDQSPQTPQERIFSTALKMLAARPRSRQQLREKLLSKPWTDSDLVDSCIKRLEELGYIDDKRFAENYASFRLVNRPVGRARVARELATRKVSKETAEKALDSVFEETGEEQLIERALEKRLRTHGLPRDQKARKRLFDHLVRLGFSYDLIIRKIRRLNPDSAADIDDIDQ